MAFMKKDVNLGLLVLIIASIILFSGFTVYYQTAFKDVSLEYQTKLEQLSQVTKELSTKRQELNETYSMRVKAEQDRQVLDQQYKEVSDENENLRVELIATNSQLAEKKAELDVTKSLLQNVQNERDTYKAQRDSYKSDLDEVCADYTTLNNGEEHEEC
jgi:septal ring factor EnvC (AmiA/AmiB activator)